MKFYKLLLENILLPLGDMFFSSSYSSSLKKMRKIVNYRYDEIINYQKSRLGIILKHAVKDVPFYHSIELDNSSDPVLWLKSFPVLEKSVLRDNIDSLLTCSSSKLIRNYTSGSTGTQTIVYVTKYEQSLYRAAQTIWWEWAGYYPGYPILQTGLSTNRSLEKKIKDFFFRTYYLFAFGLTHKDVSKALNWARDKNPVLGGYASSLYVISQLAEDQPRLKFKSAVSWGDKLFSHYRSKIESTFDCKVYETYGAGEGLMIAAQKDLDYMYIMSPCVYLEIVDEEGNEVSDGELGYVVVTSLIAESMPLIRYKLGDLAIKLPVSDYPVNRDLSLPLLKMVVGRETDLVITPSNKKLIVHSFTGIFEYYSQIKQFCVIQRNKCGIDIQYIKNVNFQESVLSEIKNRILTLINEPFEINFIEVENIPPTKSGKPQIIISLLDNIKL